VYELCKSARLNIGSLDAVFFPLRQTLIRTEPEHGIRIEPAATGLQEHSTRSLRDGGPTPRRPVQSELSIRQVGAAYRPGHALYRTAISRTPGQPDTGAAHCILERRYAEDALDSTSSQAAFIFCSKPHMKAELDRLGKAEPSRNPGGLIQALRE
jgi:hypothetical protein